MFSYISLEIIWVCMIMVQPNQGCGPPTSCMLLEICGWFLDFSPEYHFRIESSPFQDRIFFWIFNPHHFYIFLLILDILIASFSMYFLISPKDLWGIHPTSQVHQAWRKRKRLCMDTLSTLGAGDGMLQFEAWF